MAKAQPQLNEPDPLGYLGCKAIGWVVRLTSGEATTADMASLELWRREGPMHEQAFAEAVRLWRFLRWAARDSVSATSNRL